MFQGDKVFHLNFVFCLFHFSLQFLVFLLLPMSHILFLLIIYFIASFDLKIHTNSFQFIFNEYQAKLTSHIKWAIIWMTLNNSLKWQESSWKIVWKFWRKREPFLNAQGIRERRGKIRLIAKRSFRRQQKIEIFILHSNKHMWCHSYSSLTLLCHQFTTTKPVHVKFNETRTLVHWRLAQLIMFSRRKKNESDVSLSLNLSIRFSLPIYITQYVNCNIVRQ